MGEGLNKKEREKKWIRQLHRLDQWALSTGTVPVRQYLFWTWPLSSGLSQGTVCCVPGKKAHWWDLHSRQYLCWDLTIVLRYPEDSTSVELDEWALSSGSQRTVPLLNLTNERCPQVPSRQCLCWNLTIDLRYPDDSISVEFWSMIVVLRYLADSTPVETWPLSSGTQKTVPLLNLTIVLRYPAGCTSELYHCPQVPRRQYLSWLLSRQCLVETWPMSVVHCWTWPMSVVRCWTWPMSVVHCWTWPMSVVHCWTWPMSAVHRYPADGGGVYEERHPCRGDGRELRHQRQTDIHDCGV